MENRKVLLSTKDVEVKFKVRGRILTAIRGISLDIYENESIAIVGESGSGKSVFTKTFAGMLDQNGFISNGSVVFNDDELADTSVSLGRFGKFAVKHIANKLDSYSSFENGGETYKAMIGLKSERKSKKIISDEDDVRINDAISDLQYKLTEAENFKQTLDRKADKKQIEKTEAEIKKYEEEIKDLEKEKRALISARKKDLSQNIEYNSEYSKKMAELKKEYRNEISAELTEDKAARNLKVAKEMYLSVGRYSFFRRVKGINTLLRAFKKAMKMGEDIGDEKVRENVYRGNVLRVNFTDENENTLHGRCVLDLANIKYPKDWEQIRGNKIATVFQDPMTSLNPIITIGKQITSTILKHQNCSEAEARQRALKLMYQVGIPNADQRFDDYPFQYSGGMRQRIVIAIALSCQPKILICDEPTTALDVTIQAQILELIKALQKEYNYTIVFITHDLGVVANIADRVAVLYAGQLIELGKVDEVFYDPKHPYTWALLSSLPQLAQKGMKLYSITGTPPSLYNKIVGDAFAPRNPYCLKVDTLAEPPLFKVSETHWAKTWLLDPRAPQTEKPEIIKDIHGKLIEAFNI